MVYPRTVEKNIEFTMIPINLHEGPIYAYNDEVRMSEILINLLNNSIKYTPNGGKITWTVEIKKNPLLIHNTIKDNGIGMSKEFQKRMFNKYTQEQITHVRHTQAHVFKEASYDVPTSRQFCSPLVFRNNDTTTTYNHCC